MTCRVYFPPFFDNGITDKIIFNWLDVLPTMENGCDAYVLSDTCNEISFLRIEDAIIFRLKFGI